MRGDAPSCSLEGVQPMALFLPGLPLFRGSFEAAAFGRCCPWWGEAGRVSAALVTRLSSLSFQAGLSRLVGACAGLFEASV